MAEPPFDLASAHRWFGIELNNRIMDALEAGRVTPETGESFIHAAHASCHHWMQVGTVANHGRGEFVVASVYAASVWAALSDAVEEAVSGTGIPESEAPSMSLHLDVKTRKKASGKGPYPKLVEVFGEVVRECEKKVMGLRTMLKWKVAVALFKLLCFVRIHSLDGLERWIAHKLSVPHAF